MDQGCQDIPMRLDIEHQPLNFDIYLEQVIDIPKTSIDEPPYNFNLEQEALKRVDRIIERTLSRTKRAVNDSDQQQEDPNSCPDGSLLLALKTTSTDMRETVTQSNEQRNSQSQLSERVPNPFLDSLRVPMTNTVMGPSPSCPMEVPLTPIKCFIEPLSSTNMPNTIMGAQATTSTSSRDSNCDSDQSSNPNRSAANLINPLEFEEMHYNPFDHLELQTIDERKELDLVFQASYANRASKQ